MRPSFTGVGDAWQVFDLSTNLPADEAGINVAALQADQMTNVTAAQLSRLKCFSFSFVMFREIKLLCDVSMGIPKPFVPGGYRRRVFMAVHNLSRVGMRATRRMLTKRWGWKVMKADISRWCKECISCQVSKVTKHTFPQMREIPVPSRQFTKVNLDIVGPLPPLQGFCYLLTMIDRNTRWLEVTELNTFSRGPRPATTLSPTGSLRGCTGT